jgi:hypothetical protein
MILEKIKHLEKRIHCYNSELEDLHINEPSEKWYKMRKSEIEHEIASLEAKINELTNEYILEKTKSKRLLAKCLIILFIALFIYMIFI